MLTAQYNVIPSGAPVLAFARKHGGGVEESDKIAF